MALKYHDDRYDRVTFRGVTVNKWTRAALLEVEKVLGYQLTIWQGSYHKGVKKSAGTHDGGGVVDLNGHFDATRKVKAMRDHGFVADHRTQPRLSGEIHAVLIGDDDAALSARNQVGPMMAGRDGLAGNGRQIIKYTPEGGYKQFDYEASIKAHPPVPSHGKTPVSFTSRHGQLNVCEKRITESGRNGNFKDVQKGKDYKDRVPGIAKLVDTARVSHLNTQESGPYAAADMIDRAIPGDVWNNILHGDDFGDLTNAVHWNRKSREMVFEGKFTTGTASASQGHNWATWVLLRDIPTRLEYLEVTTHCEYRKGATADKTREKQCASLIVQARKIANGRPIVFAGDFNSDRHDAYDGPGKAFRAAGIPEAEVIAKKKVNGDMPTTNQLHPAHNGRKLDRFFLQGDITVNEYGILFAAPSTDHNMVYVSLTMSGLV